MQNYTDIIEYINTNNFQNQDVFYDDVIKLINKNIIKKNNCYIITHNGLGDNITMIGAVRFLTHFYDNVFVSVKNNNNYNNMKEIYETNTKITLLPIDQNNEFSDIKNKIISLLKNNETDIFVSGSCHRSYIKNNITNNEFINHITKSTNNNFAYKHIVDFYNDININFKVYYTYFNIFDTKTSMQLYDNIKMYNIIFVHTKSSTNTININMDNYINNDAYIIISPNQNFYKKEHKNFSIAENYLNFLIINYITIIKNATIINVIDSCFSCIVIPLQLKNELKANEVNIFSR
jgi:hypothetical protein